MVDGDISHSNVFIISPEDEYNTGVDSDASDDEYIGNINHFPGGTLSQLRWCWYQKLKKNPIPKTHTLVPITEATQIY